MVVTIPIAFPQNQALLKNSSRCFASGKLQLVKHRDIYCYSLERLKKDKVGLLPGNVKMKEE